MNLSIKELEDKLLHTNEMDETFYVSLKSDRRKGVQKLLQRYEAHREKMKMLEEMHVEMTKYELKLRSQGFHLIAGIDEVGRGPLAGPVVAAAVILPNDFKLLGLTDSKKLSKEKREAFAKIIKEQATAYSIQMIHADKIDEINIYESTKLAMTKAVHELNKVDHLLLDAINLDLDIPQTSLIKGDQKSITIAAASVLAKVTRDQYMTEIELEFPGYGFHQHVGYGTKEHLQAVSRLGITREHRKSFRPIKEMQ
ncbi:ribonuclease HII [Halalkalibacter akibai]|uniref:Ribonuclease HII n=1 Tax=Halalkalibacter akibai (strain ATCC 43226 / DSM 21942 / CIP 109018 / JCM 9157 / 1139) TaxID=1236973 RepID=W4QRK2_HALA3|nr:ribonuclease HII [Halalkalibacter akibai]GAE33934.1 ribonuclease HII [Halalkalibacter akibai JCM 9157]